MPVSHVVIIFFTTAGQNGENLGSDEEQIVQVTYLLYDVVKNQVMLLLIIIWLSTLFACQLYIEF